MVASIHSVTPDEQVAFMVELHTTEENLYGC